MIPGTSRRSALRVSRALRNGSQSAGANRAAGRAIALAVLVALGAAGSAWGDFNYPDFSSVAGLTLVNSADQSGSVLRLTEAEEGESGAAWYTLSKAYVADGFDTTFTIQMSADGADGMAFVIQDDYDMALGAGGSGLGYEGIPRSLAIEFDTFGFDPETGNHISVQTRGNDFNTYEDNYSLGQTNVSTDLNDGQPHYVYVRYRPGVLLVYLDGQPAPVINIELDLQNIDGDNILDGSGDAWVGFTAGTGSVYQTQDVLNWNFDETSGPLPEGACCTLTGCVQATAADCARIHFGFFGGELSNCGKFYCGGACCLPDGGCIDTEVDDCILVEGGDFLGIGKNCESESCNGACCDPYGNCSIVSESDCMGLEGIFHGSGTSCYPTPCTLPQYGGCCLGNECLQMTQDECAIATGAWFGAGSSCFEVNCFDEPGPFGACCQPDGSCRDAVAAGPCEHFNGIYHGDDTECAIEDCTPPNFGACCVPGEGCLTVSPMSCAMQGGYFQGEGSSCGNPLLNCEELGRCCFTTGGCTTTSVDYCFNVLGGGLFSTPGTCNDFDCNQYGACCTSEGCFDTWDFICSNPGDIFWGTGVLCENNPCSGDCSCPGDVTNDGRVDGEDIYIFVGCYLATIDQPPLPGCECADVETDGLLTLGDVGEFVGALLTEGPACP